MIYKGINFNGSHYKNGADEVWCNWDDSSNYLFVGERHVFLISTDGIEDPSVVYRSLNNLRVNYRKDENDSVMVDLTDYIRTCIDDCSVDIELSGGLSKFQLLVSWSQRLLRDPWKVPIPKSSIQGLLITPPSRMLTSLDGVPIDTSYIWNEKGTSSSIWKRKNTDTPVWIDTQIGTPFLVGGVGVDIGSDGTVKGRFKPKEVECGVRYAVIKWRSFVGPYKTHTFEIKSQKTEAQDDYSLLMVDNSYNEIRGSEESLILSIDELDTYNLWYYSDILTSSEVSLMVCDGKVFYEISPSKETVGGIRLEITTKSVTIPSGERADGKLEFEAKIKRYDAVNL